ncbi:MAG: glycosyltransferase family 2 protein [Prevotellaceae bacterium]|nr:glycosyltransferase family 2 protein [Prevotellaceae bacterium]
MKKETTIKNPSVSLVVSTYNNIPALELALKSIEKQSDMPKEIIIADDGSADDVRQFIDDFRQKTQLPIMHCRQEDKGFRLAAIRNKAIAMARYDYIIMTDGDIVLHRDFVKEHRRNAQKGYFLQGSRVMLSEELTRKMFLNKTLSASFFSKEIKNKHNRLHIPFITFLFPPFKILKFSKIKGCNASFWKSDLIKVNGYNESFVGWGSEDKELAVRLYSIGLKMKWLKCSAICYHLFHPLHVNEDLFEKNNRLLSQSIRENNQRCEVGIDQYV